MAEPSPIFKWDTLREIGKLTLTYRPPVPGKIYEVELTCGLRVQVWRAEEGNAYFCHGLTFGGTAAPGGPVSPFSGEDVRLILANHYDAIDPEAAARPGDILVWRGPAEETPHSAILLIPVFEAGQGQLAYDSLMQTKNGIEPETVQPLGSLIADYYGESYQVFRRR